MSSTFEVPVIQIHLTPHPNADTLSLVKIGGYQVVVKTEEWKEGQLAVWVPPDAVVPDTEEFKFLEGKLRTKARRFRGEWSHGFLIPNPSGSKLGDNVARTLNIIPYEPASSSREGMSSRDRKILPWYSKIFTYWKEAKGRPRGRYPYYDIENFRKLQDLFRPGEKVLITEKIHGANALYINKRTWYGKERIFIRSRTMWKWPFKRDWWQDAYRNTPALEDFIRDNPGMAVYGEVYGGNVQPGFEYGKSVPHFVAFDIWEDNTWMRQDLALELLAEYSVPTVPLIQLGYYQEPEHLMDLLEDNKYSELATQNGKKQIAEGLVIQSLETRKILKLVSNYYLEKV